MALELEDGTELELEDGTVMLLEHEYIGAGGAYAAGSAVTSFTDIVSMTGGAVAVGSATVATISPYTITGGVVVGSLPELSGAKNNVVINSNVYRCKRGNKVFAISPLYAKPQRPIFRVARHRNNPNTGLVASITVCRSALDKSGNHNIEP